MRIRETYILKDTSVSDSETLTQDIKLTDPIAEIEVRYRATNGATSCQQHRIRDDVSKVELVDGSDVLYSLPMISGIALNFYEAGELPPAEISEAGGVTQYETVFLRFGRFLTDYRLALDPQRFANLQLRLTHALTIDAAAGFATGTGYVTVIARVLENAPQAPEGFLMSKEHYSWTTAASGDEVIDLPIDYPYRLLGVRAYEHGVSIMSSITNVKLTLDSDKVVPFDLASRDLVYLCERTFGWARYCAHLFETNNDTIMAGVSVPRCWDIFSRKDLDFATADAIAGDKLTLSVTKTTTTPTVDAETSDVALGQVVQGVAPEGVLAYLFGAKNDPDTWLDPTPYKSSQLKVTQGNAGAAASVFLQQLRRY